ncbi:MAG: hypothetical protein EOO43_07230 [Flavobacterium sp.]|nr:MAG: hypothetical protein EOO43_07230 [Flavobacterium sp.]
MKKRNALRSVFFSVLSISVWDIFLQVGVLNSTSVRILWVLSIGTFIYSAKQVLIDRQFEDKYFRILFILFFIYQILIVYRGFVYNAHDLLGIFREPHIFWPFLIPLFAFTDKRLINFAFLFRAMYWVGVIFLAISICFPQLLLTRSLAQIYIPTFAFSIAFLLMNSYYFGNTRTTVVFFVILISLLAFVYLARRSAALTALNFLLSSFILNFFSDSKRLIFKIFPIIILAVFGAYFLRVNTFDLITKKFEERLHDDTRSDLFDVFFLEMKNYEVFGKGMNGAYYYPMEETEQDDGVVYGEVINRNTIENGYLQLFLNGGFINVILFALILVPAAIQGIFHSSNNFTRACGVVIFFWMIDMFFFGLPTLSFHYILVWICVGVCYRPSLRKMSNSMIIREINFFR